MITKCFFFDLEEEGAKGALTEIMEKFYCFMWEVFEKEELYIEAREEDWPAIERIIAPFI